MILNKSCRTNANLSFKLWYFIRVTLLYMSLLKLTKRCSLLLPDRVKIHKILCFWAQTEILNDCAEANSHLKTIAVDWTAGFVCTEQRQGRLWKCQWFNIYNMWCTPLSSTGNAWGHMEKYINDRSFLTFIHDSAVSSEVHVVQYQLKTSTQWVQRWQERKTKGLNLKQ